MTDTALPAIAPFSRLEYFYDVRLWHGYIRFLASPTILDWHDTNIQDLYEELFLSHSPISALSEESRWPKSSAALAALERHRRLVVLGDPGSGKSTLINWIAWTLATSSSELLPPWLKGKVPIPLVLRELHLNEVSGFSSLLNTFLKHPVAAKLNKDALIQLFEQGQVVVLADGLDEVKQNEREHLRNALWEGFDKYSNCYFMATSRIVGYDDCPTHHEDWKAGEQIDRFSEKKKSRAALYYVMPFTQEQVQAFAYKWYNLRSIKPVADTTAEGFVYALLRNNITKTLARNPFLLTLMALVFRCLRQLPDGRAKLFDLISQAYLQSIDAGRKLSDDTYPWREKHTWLARVGFEMQLLRTNAKEDNPEVGADSPDHGLLVQYEKIEEWLAKAMAESGRKPNPAELNQFLSWIAQRSGLLVPRGEGFYAFSHQCFQEYFAAVYLVRHITDADWVMAHYANERYELGDERITPSKLKEWCGYITWHETFSQCFEHLEDRPKNDSRRLCEYLFGKDFKDLQTIPATSNAEEARNNNRLGLLAYIYADPYSGLINDKREQAFNLLWQYLKAIERRFDDIGLEWNTEIFLNILYNIKAQQRFTKKLIEEQPQILNLCHATFADWHFITQLAQLKKLDLSFSDLKNLNLLAESSQLEELFLQAIPTVNDLTPLMGLKNLKHLKLSELAVTDLHALNALRQLETLDINLPNIKSLEPLKNLPNLKRIILYDPTSGIQIPPELNGKIQFYNNHNRLITDITQH